MLAHHWEQAGEHERAVDYLLRAGEQAAAQYANEEAIGYFSRALDLTPQDDLETRFALLVAREAVYNVQGAREAQHADLETLEALVEAIDDDGRRAEVAWRKARYTMHTDLEAAIVAAQEAVRLAQAAHDVESQVQSHLLWAQALLGQRDTKGAQIQCQKALALSQAAALYETQATSLCILGLDSLRRDPAQGQGLL